MKILTYFQACHNLFELGFLSHDKVMNMESTVLAKIDKDYEFFSSWITTLLKEGGDIVLNG